MSIWRFLNTGSQNGFHNMAIDEVLATQSVPHDKRSILRIYQWEPYAISLGYNQNPDDLDLEKCKRDNIDVVRRPTGGRAVLHAEEITYSVVIPKESDFFSPDILTTYNRISEGILAGLNLFGVKAELVQRLPGDEKSSSYKNKIPCFSGAAKYEIVYQNRKLVGSAQRRYETAILQHGSILVGTFHLRLANYVAAMKPAQVKKFQQALEEKTISISQILTGKIHYDKLIRAIKNGFQECCNIDFLEGQLTPHELAEAKKLVKKYQKS
ncbi:lipoate--protein ligase family protein, partial [candidate division KSB1 bacterium]|nr:lipoate--protein ligase family protein [candidate division KSB1 bacterium]